MKKIDFIIFYEHKAREWTSVNLLKLKLESEGLCGVIFPKHFHKYICLIMYRPKIIIVPYLYSCKNDQHLMFESIYGKIPVLNLHSEQIHDETTKAFQMPHDEYAAKAYHISWGEKFADALIEYGVSKDRIFKTGSIRNDLTYSDCEVELFKERLSLSKKILIPTAFSKTFVSKVYIDKLTKLDAIDRDVYLQKVDITRSVRNRFFIDIFELSQMHMDVIFSFRPHPYVEISDYIDVFLKVNRLKRLPDNLRVERNGSIQEEIIGSNKVITWYSSTAIDAYILNRDVIVYEPIETPGFMKIDFIDYFNSAKTLSDLSSFISKDDFSGNDSETDLYIKSIYGEVDGASCDRVAHVVSQILNIDKPKYRFTKAKYTKFMLKALAVDVMKFVFLKLNVLHLIKPFYKGVLEDDMVNNNLNSQECSETKFKMLLTTNGHEILRK